MTPYDLRRAAQRALDSGASPREAARAIAEELARERPARMVCGPWAIVLTGRESVAELAAAAGKAVSMVTL